MTLPAIARHVVVVGGGISGLAAAERLARESPPLRVTLLEASDRLGGIIDTERVGGYVMERGPDVVVASKPATRALCERLGIADRLHGTAVRGALVSRAGVLRRLPEGLSGLMPTRLAPLARSGLLTPWGLARVATEPWRPAAPDDVDESVASFMTRRFGREMYERITEPLLTGIYAGSGAQLSLAATFPQLHALERAHGSLLRGLRATGATTRTPNGASAFLSLPTGLVELVESVESALVRSGRVTIRRASPALSVRKRDGGACVELADGDAIWCDAVVVATPAPIAATLLRAADAALAGELARIAHGSTATVTLAYARADVPRALDATGYVVPRIEDRPVLACTWSSSKLAGRAPADAALFRLFVGGARRPELVDESDDALVGIARAELRATLGVGAGPRIVRVARWRRVMPQYDIGHLARVERIERRIETLPWLAVAGNAFRGVGVPDCIASGERAAQRVVAQLRTCAETGERMPTYSLG